MDVYNSKFLKGNQRMINAILAGLASSIGCALLYAIVVSMLHFSSSLFYVAIAYAISYAVKTYGKGVDSKFSFVGAGFTLFSIILAEVLILLFAMGFHLYLIPTLFVLVLSSFFSISINNIISLLCIAYSLYLAYYNSRII